MQIHEPNNRVDVTTPQGDGVIWLVTEYGHETDTMYTIILNNGEIWQFTHKDIRVKDNVTFNRVFTKTEKPKVGTAVLNRNFSSENPASATTAICLWFQPSQISGSITQCANCGKEKWQHPNVAFTKL
jgi:hypothetical protein